MAALSLEERLEGRRNFSSHMRQAIDEETSPTSLLRHTVRSLVGSTCQRYHAAADTQVLPLFEYDCHDLWYIYLRFAKLTDVEDALMDSGVLSILTTRSLGTLVRQSATKDELEVARTSDGLIWTDLPFFGKAIEGAWANKTLLSDRECKNLAGFCAKLLAVDVCVDGLVRCAVECFEEAFRAVGNETDNASELQVAFVLVWLRYAGKKLFLIAKAGSLERSLDLDRWTMWKKKLEVLEEPNDEVKKWLSHMVWIESNMGFARAG
ncbi:hypothetical protein C1H76_0350 [Elsinoe australis]|uniref:Uncharacterized protein n=1 Tax=Elsinoe australis TaxID=40998 RepID=A0A4V6DVA5_9PEZI|nr:hypothetical protein C1H76_0350 [Elsinoe australis]